MAAFIPAWCSGAGVRIPGASFISPLTPPLSYMGPAVGAWMILGVAYLIYLFARDRQRITQVGLVYLDA